MDAFRSTLINAAYQVSVYAFCHKWNHWSRYLAQCNKCCVQCHVCINLVLFHSLSPESLTASSYIPVRELIYKVLKNSCCLCNLVILKVVINCLNKSIELGKNPFVHNWKLIILKCVPCSIEIIYICIQNEECVCVPDCSHELSLTLCNCLVIESVRKPRC